MSISILQTRNLKTIFSMSIELINETDLDIVHILNILQKALSYKEVLRTKPENDEIFFNLILL